MSALPPKADIAGRQLDVCFVPKADILHCGRNWHLFDHLVGGGKQRRRDGQTKRLRSLEIDHQLVFGRLLNRQLTRLSAFEDAVDVFCRHR